MSGYTTRHFAWRRTGAYIVYNNLRQLWPNKNCNAWYTIGNFCFLWPFSYTRKYSCSHKTRDVRWRSAHFIPLSGPRGMNILRICNCTSLLAPGNLGVQRWLGRRATSLSTADSGGVHIRIRRSSTSFTPSIVNCSSVITLMLLSNPWLNRTLSVILDDSTTPKKQHSTLHQLSYLLCCDLCLSGNN